MTEYKAEFIKIPIGEAGFQTMPTEPARRLKESEVSIKLCDETDVDQIAEGFYAAFPESWWRRREPPELRPEQSIRQKRLATRLRPTFMNSNMKWVKAVLTSTGEIIGVAGWQAPGNPVHNILRYSAFDFYGWKDKMGLGDDVMEEMWKGFNVEKWDEQLARDDEYRKDLLGDEPHWYLAPLFTWPEYQGRGVGKKLLDWAIEQADATEPVTPMYLESAPTARAVYMHCGFVPQGESNFLRRGPAVVRGLEAEDVHEAGKIHKLEKAPAQVIETGM